MTDREYDLIVLGGGAAGLTAARESRRRGARTLLVNDGPIGGDCTFTGCVPSKALIAAAARGCGFNEAMNRVHDAIRLIAAREDAPTLESEGIDVARGHGCVRSPNQLDVESTRYSTKRLIIATGATAAVPTIPGLDVVPFLTNETVFSLQRQPTSMIVLGGGATGVELAQAFARLRTRVTVLETLDRVVAREEPDASQAIREALNADGVDIRTSVTVTNAEAARAGACVRLGDGEVLHADQLLVATGRSPVTRGIGLEEAGVRLDERGFIRADDTMATAVPGVWAIGDVVGGPMFTHAAVRMGFIAVHNALDRTARLRRRRFRTAAIPSVTFTAPQIGRVGMTEGDARRVSGARVAYLPLDEVDRAVAEHDTRGFIKLIAVPRRALRNLGGGRLIGATIVAPTGGELVDEVAFAISTHAFTGQLAQAIHAYPTWSSALQQTAAQFFLTYGGRSARPVADA